MRISLRFAILVLLVVGAQGALASDRLIIELLPVYTVPTDAENEFDVIADATLATHEAFIATRRAMAMLGALPEEYDLVLSEHQYEVLTCTRIEPDGPDTQCTHDREGLLTEDQMRVLYRTLGYITDEVWWRPQGTILLMVIMRPDTFLWNGGSLGVASQAWWGGYNAETSHWTTGSCAAWAHLLLNTIAHELGHCFGLEHNGAGDRHFDGVDNSFDLMQATRGLDNDAHWLKSSNQQRVRRHFRDLGDDDPAVSRSLDTLIPMQTTVID